jgi:hypothetical protein
MLRTACALILASMCLAACSHADSQQPASQQSASQKPASQPPASQQPGSQSPAAAGEQPPAPASGQPQAAAPAAAPAPGVTANPSGAPAPVEAQPNAAPPSKDPAPPAPPTPQFREVTIPAGTSLSITLLSTVASNTSKVEDPVKGSLAKPIVAAGKTVVPSGAEISGTVTDAKESGRVKGRASVAFRFDRLVVGGEPYRIQTAPVTHEAEKDTKSDVKKGAVGGGMGAIVGGVVGGGKGAAIGAVAGGTAGVLGTKGQEVNLQPGTVITAHLQQPITVTVRVK